MWAGEGFGEGRWSFFRWDSRQGFTGLRGRWDFVDWCIMCRSNGETVDHLLLHCGKVYRLWSLVFRSFGFFWVLPRSVADALFGWWNWPGKHLSSIWNLAPLCLMWCLWRERNRRTFEDKESLDDQLLAISVALCLIGLGRGDSPLVILSLCSLAPSFVLSIFPFLFLFTFSFPYVFFSLPYVFCIR